MSFLLSNCSSSGKTDADPKTIRQIECVRQLKNTDGVNANGVLSMSASTT